MIDHHGIEAFLAVVTTGSISKAAELLMVSQSSISKWIQQLEEAVGAPLILRHRGHRGVQLSACGQELVPLAEQWLSLQKTILSLNAAIRPSLRVAGVDSLNSTVMPRIYRRLTEDIPDLDLTVTTNQTGAIYQLVERRQFDVGLVLSESRVPGLTVRPFLVQNFCLLRCGKSHKSALIHPQELDPERELFLPWGLSYQQWHDYWWPNPPHRRKVDTISLMDALFTQPGMWTVVPDSVADQFSHRDDLQRLELSAPPPARTCYYVIPAGARDDPFCPLDRFLSLLETPAVPPLC